MSWQRSREPDVGQPGVYLCRDQQFSFLVVAGVVFAVSNVTPWHDREAVADVVRLRAVADELNVPLFELRQDLRRRLPFRWVPFETR